MNAPLYSHWPGTGDHSGHTVTLIERWEARLENLEAAQYAGTWISCQALTVGRVRCSCNEEWDIGALPDGWTECDGTIRAGD